MYQRVEMIEKSRIIMLRQILFLKKFRKRKEETEKLAESQ